ncbi:MAG: T9SS type A sorting domain-containing protein, partial [FCB group bacterium]|nr:T9SS type A sorting domain-containing protein [FCB group bacterium]
YNWWGDATGADHSSNPHGTGQGGTGASDNVDFTPWLATGTTTSSNQVVTVNHTRATIAVSDNLKGGVDAAVDTGTIEILAGAITTESEQIIVAKNLTINGDAVNMPTVQAAFDTGSSGDSRGWFLVDPDYQLDMNNIIFDGNGYLIYQGFRHKGTGSFTNCVFTDIKFNESGPNYSGVGVAVFGNPGNPVDFSNCTFSDIGRVGVLYFGSGANGSVYDNCTYTGKGNGDWLDYGVEAGAGAQITVQNSTFSNCTGVASSDGSTSAGILVTTYFGAGTQCTLEWNSINNNTAGIAVGYDNTDTSVLIAHNNNIINNADFGVSNTSLLTSVNAEYNWWGDATGPGGEGPGAGDAVDPNVIYDPWLGKTAGSVPMTFITLEDDIQGIIDNPDVLDGDTILLGTGTYTNAIVINKAITLTAGSNPVLDGGGAGSGITITVPGVTISELDITNWDVGIEITGSGNATVSDCNITSNTTWGIHNLTSNLCNAENNWWGSNGGPDGTNNPNGTPTINGGGNAVGDYVDADPWLGGVYNGNCLEFDGVNDFVYVPDDASLDVVNTITIEAWVYRNGDQPGWRLVVDRLGSGTDDIWGLGFYNNKYAFFVNTTNGWTPAYTSTNTAPNGEWLHICGVYDGSTNKIYVNGVLEFSGTHSGTLPNVSTPVTIGCSSSGPGSYVGFFNGKIEETRIWSSARTLDEIRGNMHKEVGPGTAGLVGYWRFNDGSGTTAADKSGYHNYGTLTNMDNADWVISTAPMPYTTTGTTSNWSLPTTWYSNTIPNTNWALVDVGHTVNVDGNFSVKNIDILYSGDLVGSAGNTLSITGDFTNNGTFTHGNGTISFAGSADQNISGCEFYNLTINNGNGNSVILHNACTVQGTLTLTSGKVNTTNANILTLGTSATASFTSSLSGGTSYVDGPIEKRTNSAGEFIFPTGADGILREIGYLPIDLGTTTSIFRAEFFNSGYSPNNYQGHAPLTWVSEATHWTIARTSGTTSAILKLFWGTESNLAAHIPDLSGLVIAKYNAGDQRWSSMGGPAGGNGNLSQGFVQSYILYDFSSADPVSLGDTGSPLENDNLDIPLVFALDPAHPNPFNPATTIDYQLPNRERVTITVYDVEGRAVKQLVDEYFDAGYYSTVWSGNEIPSGMYFIRMVAGHKYQKTQKVIVLK